MSITKLMHIKERKTGNKSAGLENAIYYIMNPDKTQDQKLVYSNCGTSEVSIINAFMDTKKMFDKFEGRQGYHFVVSFSPQENVSTQICSNVMKDFAEELLKGEYDFVAAVHDDTEHMHGHLVFNSVNNVTGRKYRYEDGDWEKYIQPITDRIAEKYGLTKLEYTKASDEEKINWKAKITQDITECIMQSRDYKDFLDIIKSNYGYKIREGFSDKHGYYVTYTPPGKAKGVRSYTLPLDCQPEEIYKRLELKGCKLNHIPVNAINLKKKISIKNSRSYTPWKYMNAYQKDQLRKILTAKRLYGKAGSSTWESTRIMRDINAMLKIQSYMIVNGINTQTELENKISEINTMIESLRHELKGLKKKYGNFIYGNPSKFTVVKEYIELKNQEVSSDTTKLFEGNEEAAYILEKYEEYNEATSQIKEKLKELNKQKKQLEKAKIEEKNNYNQQQQKSKKQEQEKTKPKKRKSK